MKSSDYAVSDGFVATIISTYTTPDSVFVKPNYTSYDVRTGSMIKTQTAVTPVAEWSCGVRAIRRGTANLLLDVLVTRTPAQGINHATISLALRAIDARTMTILWTTPIVQDMVDEWGLCTDGIQEVSISKILPTLDGSYALMTYPNVTLAVDLSNGQAKPVADAVAVVGNWIVTQKNDNGAVALVDPRTGTVAGTVTPSFVHSHHADTGRVLAVTDSEVAAFDLPSGTSTWKASLRLNSPYLTYEAQAGVFLFSEHSYGAKSIVALSPQDGHTLWGPVSAELCGATSGKLVVSANNQLAVLDASTGKQLSYDATTSQCPKVLPGAMISEKAPGQRALEVF